MKIPPAIKPPLAAERNVLITGLPRAGTTLLASLLNRLPDTVALVEPLDARRFMMYREPEDMVDGITKFIAAQRCSILQNGTAISFHTDGNIPDNFFGDHRDSRGKRVNLEIQRGEIRIGKQLADDFLFAIKDNASFTALLAPLSARFPVFAVVRNPLSVLASWRSVSLPVANGHVPMAEAIDGQLAAELAEMDDVHARQIHILGWFYAKFLAVLPASHIIRYEEVISTSGKALSVINPLANTLDEKLENRNRNKLYDKTVTRELQRRLINTDGAYWQFYDRESIANFPT